MTRGRRQAPSPQVLQAGPGRKRRSLRRPNALVPLDERFPLNTLDGCKWSFDFTTLDQIEREIARAPALRDQERARKFLLGWIDRQAGAYVERASLRAELGFGSLAVRIGSEIAADPRGIVSNEVAEHMSAKRNRGRGRGRTPRERLLLVQSIAAGFRLVGVPARKSQKSVLVNVVRLILRAADPVPPTDVLEVVRTALGTPLRESEPLEPMVIERILPSKKLGEK